MAIASSTESTVFMEMNIGPGTLSPSLLRLQRLRQEPVHRLPDRRGSPHVFPAACSKNREAVSLLRLCGSEGLTGVAYTYPLGLGVDDDIHSH